MTENIKQSIHNDCSEYEIAAFSGIGRRAEQQDAGYCYAMEKKIYAVVCDGMGGLEGGRRASDTAVSVAERAFANQLALNRHGPDWLSESILAADQEVSGLTDSNGVKIKCGSTFASLFIDDMKLFWASVGDSRIYLFHDREVIQVTTDLNYAFYLNQQLQSGSVSRQTYDEEIASGDALVSFVGIGQIEMIDRNLEPLQLCSGDTVMVCSDGLYRSIDAEWMSEIFQYCFDLQECASAMQQIIEEKALAEQDNYTCIMIRVK